MYTLIQSKGTFTSHAAAMAALRATDETHFIQFTGRRSKATWYAEVAL